MRIVASQPDSEPIPGAIGRLLEAVTPNLIRSFVESFSVPQADRTAGNGADACFVAFNGEECDLIRSRSFAERLQPTDGRQRDRREVEPLDRQRRRTGQGKGLDWVLVLDDESRGDPEPGGSGR